MSTYTSVKALLERLHDEPADTTIATESVLAEVYDYLMGVPTTQHDGLYHWFCNHAEPLTIDAASFLLRLFAYNSPKVVQWKGRFAAVLSGCVRCVKGLAEVKLTSRQT